MASRSYNSDRYFTEPIVDAAGFREYDARWIVRPMSEGPPEVQLNYRGLTQVGNWLGRFLARPEEGGHREVLVGHDFREYAENAKNALVVGLLGAGTDVRDIGLCTTPMAYFAQHAYGVPACAMVTASHNPNGWTGVKMGQGLSQTFGPAEMDRFKELVRAQGPSLWSAERGGRYVFEPDARERYVADLVQGWQDRLRGLPRLRVALETGNGTTGIVMPRILRELGFDVVEGHTDLDWTFPHFNPNPESVPFLRSVQELVRGSRAEVGICLDGDGDRVGIVDDRARIVFSDRVALLIARRLEADGADRFVVDVKSTSLFDSVLRSTVVWVPTGHSYLKSALRRERALAAFERSGHYFFTPPLGRGYDDGCVSALVTLWILCEAKRDGKRLSGLLDELPPSHQSPNRQPFVADERKYAVVEEIAARINRAVEATGRFADERVTDVIRINGIRLHFEDGSWLLVRASSNTPNLVIVAESFDEDGARLKAIDSALRATLEGIPDVGPFEPLYET
jgi:phosphomannomutase / phosphoglucomutase